MKSSTKRLFVIVLIVMSFVAVPVVFAGTGPGYNGPGSEPGPPDHPDSCTTVVEGKVTYVSDDVGVIMVDDDITVNGLPLWLNIVVGDYVVINCRISPDGKYVACYLTINGVLVNLR
jgi:hypothetical protein